MQAAIVPLMDELITGPNNLKVSSPILPVFDNRSYLSLERKKFFKQNGGSPVANVIINSIKFQAIKEIMIGNLSFDNNFEDKNIYKKGSPMKNLDTFIASKNGYPLIDKDNIDKPIKNKIRTFILLFRKLLDFLLPIIITIK